MRYKCNMCGNIFTDEEINKATMKQYKINKEENIIRIENINEGTTDTGLHTCPVCDTAYEFEDYIKVE